MLGLPLILQALKKSERSEILCDAAAPVLGCMLALQQVQEAALVIEVAQVARQLGPTLPPRKPLRVPPSSMGLSAAPARAWLGIGAMAM